jgi:hypothetical protein
MTTDEILRQLAGYDPDTLAVWVVELNCFRWPAECPIPMPEGWTAVRHNRERMALSQPLWQALHRLVTEEDVSRVWWTHTLGRPREAWQTWWDARTVTTGTRRTAVVEEQEVQATLRRDLGG